MNYPGQISEVNICKNMAYLQIRQVKVSFTSISHDLEQEMDLITFSFDMHLLFIQILVQLSKDQRKKYIHKHYLRSSLTTQMFVVSFELFLYYYCYV
jgi:hypothetical protein